MAKAVIGLDFSGKHWKFVAVSAAYKKLRIHVFNSLPPSPADHNRLLRDIDEDPSLEDRISSWSYEVARNLGRHVKQSAGVIAGLPQDLVSVRVLSFPFNQSARIARTLPFEAEGSLPFEVDSLVFDFYPLHEQNGETRVFSAAAQRNQLSVLLERLKPLDIDPMMVTPTALAYHQLARFRFSTTELKEHRVLFVQVSDYICQMAAVEGDMTIYAGSLNMGLYPPPPRQEQRESEEENEHGELKQKPQDTEEFEHSPQQVKEHQVKLLDNLAASLQRSVHFLEGYNPAGSACPPSLARIFLVGEGAFLPGLQERIEGDIGVETEPFRIPDEVLAEESDIDEKSHAALAPALAVALEKVTPTSRTAMNFRKEEFAYQPERQAMMRKILMPGILALALLIFFAVKLVTESKIETTRANAVYSSMHSEFKKHFPSSPAEDIEAEMKKKISNLEALEAKYKGLNYPSALDCLAAISEAIPASTPITITKLDYHGEKLVLMADTETFEQANEITKQLQQVPFFHKVNLGGMDQKRDKVSFRISIEFKS